MGIEHLIDAAYERGRREATQLGESSYGATHSSIVLVPFTSFQVLRHDIRVRRHRRSGDNPGQAYMWTCELLHIHHNDYDKVAVLKCSTHYDI